MNNGLSVLALIGITGMLVAAGCENVADLGRNSQGSQGLGGDGGGSGAAKRSIGDPCTPIDEYDPAFNGYSVDEVNVDDQALQCASNLCLVNHFQGRASCPYGNDLSNVNIGGGETPPGCNIPGTTEPITVAVDPQIQPRQAQDSVYCSCRCAGPDQNARYCDCPSGFSCVALVDDLKNEEAKDLVGSYCVRKGTTYVKGNVDVVDSCKASRLNCGEVTETGEPK